MEIRNTTILYWILGVACTLLIVVPFGLNIEVLMQREGWDHILANLVEIPKEEPPSREVSMIEISPWYWLLFFFGLGGSLVFWAMLGIGVLRRKREKALQEQPSEIVFGIPVQTVRDKDIIEWSILVGGFATFERCEVFFHTANLSSAGLPLKWRTRDGTTSQITIDKSQARHVSLVARMEPHAEKKGANMPGSAIICDDNYHKRQPPFQMIPAGTQRMECWVIIHSRERRWQSDNYLIDIPPKDQTNGAFVVSPQIVIRQ